MRTAKNILRHEMIGLECTVVKARNKDQIGIQGKIIDETMKTIAIKKSSGYRAIVFKKGSEFRLMLDEKKVIVKGDHLAARPEDRIKKKIKKW